MARDYKKIKAWQLSHKLVLLIYKLTKGFPKEEMYGLTSQLRRAGVSVASNIVEGANKKSKKEYFKFLYDAKASLREVEYQTALSNELGFIEEKDFKEFSSLYTETISALYGLIKSVEDEVKKGI